MRELVFSLAECLDRAIEVQERLLDCLAVQRDAIISGEGSQVEEASAAMEVELLRLGGIETNRTLVASHLADELGIVSARWSALREGLERSEVEYLAGRVARVEDLIRDLELHNTINGQLIGTELELVDLSIRALASDDGQMTTRAYTQGGATPSPAAPRPVLLNLAA